MQPEPINNLIDRSSLGTPAARRLRSRVSDSLVDEVRRRARKEGPEMSNENNRHVVPDSNGGWKVVKPGAERASSRHETQAEAERRAKDIVGNAGGGEVRIHRPNGQIRDSDTVKPGNDPRSSKDTKH